MKSKREVQIKMSLINLSNILFILIININLSTIVRSLATASFTTKPDNSHLSDIVYFNNERVLKSNLFNQLFNHTTNNHIKNFITHIQPTRQETSRDTKYKKPEPDRKGVFINNLKYMESNIQPHQNLMEIIRDHNKNALPKNTTILEKKFFFHNNKSYTTPSPFINNLQWLHNVHKLKPINKTFITKPSFFENIKFQKNQNLPQLFNQSLSEINISNNKISNVQESTNNTIFSYNSLTRYNSTLPYNKINTKLLLPFSNINIFNNKTAINRNSTKPLKNIFKKPVFHKNSTHFHNKPFKKPHHHFLTTKFPKIGGHNGSVVSHFHNFLNHSHDKIKFLKQFSKNLIKKLKRKFNKNNCQKTKHKLKKKIKPHQQKNKRKKSLKHESSEESDTEEESHERIEEESHERFEEEEDEGESPEENSNHSQIVDAFETIMGDLYEQLEDTMTTNTVEKFYKIKDNDKKKPKKKKKKKKEVKRKGKVVAIASGQNVSPFNMKILNPNISAISFLSNKKNTTRYTSRNSTLPQAPVGNNNITNTIYNSSFPVLSYSIPVITRNLTNAPTPFQILGPPKRRKRSKTETESTVKFSSVPHVTINNKTKGEIIETTTKNTSHLTNNYNTENLNKLIKTNDTRTTSTLLIKSTTTQKPRTVTKKNRNGTVKLPFKRIIPTNASTNKLAILVKPSKEKLKTPPNLPSSPSTIQKPSPIRVVKGDNDDYEDDYYLDYDDLTLDGEPNWYDLSESEESKETNIIIVTSTLKPITTSTKPSTVISQPIVQTTQSISTKKKTPAKDYSDNDYDDDISITDYFNSFLYSIVYLISNIPAYTTSSLTPTTVEYDTLDETTPNSNNIYPKYPHYTYYGSEENVDNDTTNRIFGSWLSALFGIGGKNQQQKTAITTTEAPGWFDGWFDNSEEDVHTQSTDDDFNDKWFFDWFGSDKPVEKKPPVKIVTAPTPTLTNVTPDAVKNSENWIGILAQHIINSSTTTSTTTIYPVIDKKNSPKIKSYNQYQIWRLKPSDDNQVRILENYKSSSDGAKIHWLQGPSLKGSTDVLIPPKMATDLQGTLNFENIDHEVLIFDVGKAITYEKPQLSTKERNHLQVKLGHSMTWQRYHRYDDIVKYMEHLQMRHPSLVELIHIGRTYEGRPLIIVKVENRNFQTHIIKGSKKRKISESVFIESGSHGREWIGPATSTYILNEVVKIMNTNETSEEDEFIMKKVWYIMPVLNPDGYEYSHEYDRMWKKTRSKHHSKSIGVLDTAMTWFQDSKPMKKVCYGVDPNRNWDADWGRGSRSPCNEFFVGPNVFSEPETRALSKFLMDNRKNIKIYLSLHAYGQVISFPQLLNTSRTQKSDDLLDMAMVGSLGSAIRYKVDSTNDMTAMKSGTSDSFAMFKAGIPFSYTIQLSDEGAHGFLLPSSFIEPTSRDAFEMVKSMVDFI